jgi:hypothetical protein
MSAKPPTPLAIATLLRNAGFGRSERHGDVCTEGFHVTADISAPGVLVRYWPDPGRPHSLADTRAWLARYADVISRAGWPVQVTRHDLTVTAKENADAR